MKNEPIQRRVKQVTASGQLGLLIPMPNTESTDSVRPSPGRVVFIDPDPTRLHVGDLSLLAHLKQCGIRDVFVIRHLLKQQDWSEFAAAYRPGGRSPYAPRAMMGLILYGVMKGLSGLRPLERLACVDLGCWWLTGGMMPDHSSIGRFIQHHEALLTHDFFESLTRSVLKVTQSDVGQTAGDGTVIEAAASRYKTIKREALEKQISKAETQLETLRDTPDASEQVLAQAEGHLAQLNDAEQVLAEREEKRRVKGKDPGTTRINPQEPDAVNQPLKRGGMGASYKPSVMANDQRVVVGHAVEGSSETAVVEGLLEAAKAQGEVTESALNAGYFCDTVLELEEKHNVHLLIPEGRTTSPDWNKPPDKQYPKSQFQYDKATDTYRCPVGELLQPVSRYKGNNTHQGYTEYGAECCADCPQRDQCTSSPKGRRIKRYAGDERKETMRARFQDEATRERYRKRAAWVEPVFSHLKERQSLIRFHRKGLAGVRLEFAIHVLAYNLGRAIALTSGCFWLFYRLIWPIWGTGCILSVKTSVAFGSLRKFWPLHSGMYARLCRGFYNTLLGGEGWEGGSSVAVLLLLNLWRNGNSWQKSRRGVK